MNYTEQIEMSVTLQTDRQQTATNFQQEVLGSAGGSGPVRSSENVFCFYKSVKQKEYGFPCTFSVLCVPAMTLRHFVFFSEMRNECNIRGKNVSSSFNRQN
jgi:hypothetical protein